MNCTAAPALPCAPGCPGFLVNADEIIEACRACDHHPDDLTAVRHVLACRWCRDRAVELGAIEPRLSCCQGLDYVFDQVTQRWRTEIRSPDGGLVTFSDWYQDRAEASRFGRAWLRSLRGL